MRREPALAPRMILLIDNYDSFTYNVAQYLGELGAEVDVRRNDEIELADIERMAPEKIVVSPGPCTPDEAGISLAVVEAFGAEVPLLGICLGHQSIGQAYGGTVQRARRVMHGKVSAIHHGGRGVFRGLPPAFPATRYHSLIVADVPDCLEVTAWTAHEDGGPGRNHGPSPPRTAGGGRAVPSGVHQDAGRQAAARQFPWPLRCRPDRRERLTDGAKRR